MAPSEYHFLITNYPKKQPQDGKTSFPSQFRLTFKFLGSEVVLLLLSMPFIAITKYYTEYPQLMIKDTLKRTGIKAVQMGEMKFLFVLTSTGL